VYPNPVSSDAVIFPCTTTNCWPINSTTSRLFTTNDYKDILFCFCHFPSQSTLVHPPSFRKYLPPGSRQFFSRGFCPGFGRSVFGLLGRSSSLVHTLSSLGRSLVCRSLRCVPLPPSPSFAVLSLAGLSAVVVSGDGVRGTVEGDLLKGVPYIRGVPTPVFWSIWRKDRRDEGLCLESCLYGVQH